MIPNPMSTETPISFPYTLPGLGQVTPRALTLASAHFEDMDAHLWHHGKRLYHLPAPKVPNLGELRMESVSLLTVYDAQQWIPIIEDPEQPPRLRPAPVPVEGVALDLLNLWTKNRAGVAATVYPGIMQLKGPSPTKEEFDRLISLESAHCAALIEEADRIWVTKQGKIQPNHRSALEWMGSTRREWFKPIEPGRTKRSVVTGRDINWDALADGGEKLVDYYLLYNLNPENYGDAYVSGLFKDPKFLRDQLERLGLKDKMRELGLLPSKG